MKYLEIAKSLGGIAVVDIASRDEVGVQLTEQQLHAYTEQVCKKLLFVVDQYYRLHGAVIAQEALAAHKEMVGDKP